MPAGAGAISARLLCAYRRTRYGAADAAVRIGQRSPAMDAVLARHHARCGVFVTAWNPYSRRMPDAWNRRMQVLLRQRLRRCTVLAAGGGSGRWHEDHLLVLAPPPLVAHLARQFRQNALVVVRRGVPASLLLLAAGPVLRDQCTCSGFGSCMICSAR